MVDEAYIKQLESHIDGLNKVIDKLLTKSNLVYYIIPKNQCIFDVQSDKRYFKTLEEAFIAFHHIRFRATNSVKEGEDYAILDLEEVKKRLDIYSIDIITGERRKVWE